MIWVGLTGGIASGKSTAAQMLREMGYEVVDADELARRVVVPGSKGADALLKLLGDTFFTPQGELRRGELGRHIFARPEVRAQVESALHPLIQEEMVKEKEKLSAQGVAIAFYDVPLLFEKRLQHRFDTTLLIYTPESQQRQRLKLRENWSDEETEGRFKAQLPIDQKKPLAEHVVDNSGGLQDLRVNLKKTVQDILAGALKS